MHLWLAVWNINFVMTDWNHITQTSVWDHNMASRVMYPDSRRLHFYTSPFYYGLLNYPESLGGSVSREQQQISQSEREEEKQRSEKKQQEWKEHVSWYAQKAERAALVLENFHSFVWSDTLPLYEPATCQLCGESAQHWQTSAHGGPPSIPLVSAAFHFNGVDRPSKLLRVHQGCIHVFRSRWSIYRWTYVAEMENVIKRVLLNEWNIPSALMNHVILPYILRTSKVQPHQWWSLQLSEDLGQRLEFHVCWSQWPHTSHRRVLWLPEPHSTQTQQMRPLLYLALTFRLLENNWSSHDNITDECSTPLLLVDIYSGELACLARKRLVIVKQRSFDFWQEKKRNWETHLSSFGRVGDCNDGSSAK